MGERGVGVGGKGVKTVLLIPDIRDKQEGSNKNSPSQITYFSSDPLDQCTVS